MIAKTGLFHYDKALGVARTYDSGGQTANHTQFRYPKFSRKIFVGQKYRKMEDQKLGPDLPFNQVFVKG